jgi:hypothetical protein
VEGECTEYGRGCRAGVECVLSTVSAKKTRGQKNAWFFIVLSDTYLKIII